MMSWTNGTTDETNDTGQQSHTGLTELAAGFHSGSQWAEYASEAEAARLAAFRRSMGDAWPTALEGDGDDGDRGGQVRSPGEQLYSVLWPQDARRPQQAKAFWRGVAWRIGDEQSATLLWTLGFAEGVLHAAGESLTDDAPPPTAAVPEILTTANATPEELCRLIHRLIESTAWHPLWQHRWLRKCGAESFEDLTREQAEKLVKHLAEVEFGFREH